MAKNGFAFIDPPRAACKLRAIEVELRPLKVGELPGFAAAARPLVALLSLLGSLGEGDGQAMAAALVSAIAEQGEAVIEAVALAARIERSQVAELEADELVILAAECIRINADFFSRALPATTKAVERLQGLAAKTSSSGLKPSTP